MAGPLHPPADPHQHVTPHSDERSQIGEQTSDTVGESSFPDPELFRELHRIEEEIKELERTWFLADHFLVVPALADRDDSAPVSTSYDSVHHTLTVGGRRLYRLVLDDPIVLSDASAIFSTDFGEEVSFSVVDRSSGELGLDIVESEGFDEEIDLPGGTTILVDIHNVLAENELLVSDSALSVSESGRAFITLSDGAGEVEVAVVQSSRGTAAVRSDLLSEGDSYTIGG